MTSSTGFVHLHNHTEHSLLDGLARLGDVVANAKADGAPAVAVTDHGSEDGWYGLHAAAARARDGGGPFPIYGIEAYVALGSRHEQNWIEVERDDDTEAGEVDLDEVGKAARVGVKRKNYEHLTILAADETGFANLIAMNNAAQESYWYHPRIDYDLLKQHGEGLIVLSGCLAGPVAGPAARGDLDEARRGLETLIDCVGRDNVYVELMDHGIGAEQRALGPLVDLAREYDLPLVVTNDCHYSHADDASGHDAWLCLQSGAKVTDADRFRFNGSGYHYRTAAEMRALREEDWWAEGCDNTLVVAQRIGRDLMPPSRLRLPKFPVPEGFTDAAQYLHHLVRAGAEERYGLDPQRPGKLPREVAARLRHEFEVISNAGLHDYFLIVWDLIAWARAQGILVGPGRGSAAGSCAAYCLGIVQVDPLANHLLFERFLNPERTGMPDIDVDFEKARRGEVLAHMVELYGSDRVARIGTRGKERSKAAIKDAARVLELTPEGNRLAPLVPVDQGRAVPLDVAMDPTNQSAGAFRKMIDELGADGQQILALARRFEMVTRNQSIHACGTLIADEPMDSLVPLRYERTKGKPVTGAPMITGWEGGEVDSYGLLKMDVLGLRTLDVVALAATYIERTTGERVDAEHLVPNNPADAARDQAAWDLIASGKTEGVFQLESSGMTQLAENVRPESLADLTALVALYRPGPMAASMHVRYAERKNGRERVSYDYLTLDPREAAVIASVLDRTFASVVYQEQLMQLGEAVAGLSPAMRNMLQKAFSKKDAEKMARVREQFFAGGLAGDGPQGVAFSAQTLENLWTTFEGSASYLFNACLTGETEITLADGSVTTVADLYAQTLADHAPQVRLLALSPDRRGLEAQTMLDVHRKGLAQVHRIRLADGTVVRATEDHAFASDAGWVRVGDMLPGTTRLLRSTGRTQTMGRGGEVVPVRITDIAPDGVEEVFDVEMAEGTDHNFLAGGVVSHNSHACAYGYLAYITAYIKANWPAEFGAALLAVTDDDDKRAATLRSLVAEGVTIHAPDVNLSAEVTAPDPAGDGVRLGLTEIKGVGKAGGWIIAARERSGPFASLHDLMVRVTAPPDPGSTTAKAVPVGAFEGLIEAGALDRFGPRLGQMMCVRAARVEPDLRVEAEWGVLERTARQRARLGVSVGDHPMTLLFDMVDAQVTRTVSKGMLRGSLTSIERLPDYAGRAVLVPALVTGWDEKTYSKGMRAAVTLEGAGRESVSATMWDDDLTTLKSPAGSGVPTLGSLVLARGSARVRTVEVERVDESGEVSIERIERTELTLRDVIPLDIDDPALTSWSDAEVRLPRSVVHRELRVHFTAPGSWLPRDVTDAPGYLPAEMLADDAPGAWLWRSQADEVVVLVDQEVAPGTREAVGELVIDQLRTLDAPQDSWTRLADSVLEPVGAR